MYSCHKCKKVFDQKYNYVRHLNRKTPCSEEINPSCESGGDDSEFSCPYCEKQFAKKFQLNQKKIYSRQEVI